MKKLQVLLILFAFITIVTKSNAQTMNCGSFCVMNSITIDTVGINKLFVTIYNGGSDTVNYPSVMVVNNTGDTVANKTNSYFFFYQLSDSTVIHSIPTSLDSIPVAFTGTVYFTDNMTHQTCAIAYPSVCTAGINEVTANTDNFSIFPNPANSEIKIKCDGLKPTGITISNILGETFYQAVVSNTLSSIDISGLSNGIYFVQLQTSQGVVTKKLIKN